MTVTIPRAEIQAIAARYADAFSLDADPPTHYVRAVAAGYRDDVSAWNTPEADALRAEADDLDALADRYEREAVR